MKNFVTASIHFSFKGKRHTPSITIELDRHIESTGSLPDLYPLIAKENNFDLYSYEYEMMQAEKIIFSDAQGLVENFITDGILDITTFTRTYIENNILKKLELISERHMDINNFSQHPNLKQALLDAYYLDRNNTTSD